MDYKETYKYWLEQKELSEGDRFRLLNAGEDEIKEMFWAPLAFGTAGMRGILDPGINRMNVFSVRRATKGLADYIISLGGDHAERGIVISYDTRRCSTEFAIEVARVLSAAGVNSYLFENVRPVPVCSFAIRELNASGAVMITASHNPKIYNGYKVYGEDGAQMSPEATDKVVDFIEKTPYFGISESEASISAEDIRGKDNVKLDKHITVIGRSLDDKYFAAIERLGLSPDAVKKYGKNVKIVYTPVHGSGYMPVTEILKRMGINVSVVAEQAEPDTEFSTVRVPNPEEADTLKMGVELADKIGSDVVIGTDPDADRMGVAVRDNRGKFILLNGNQIGVLLTDYILRRKKESGTLPENGAIVKTIVSTELARKVASSYGVATIDVLTGFKFIGEKIKEWEGSGEYTYLFGFEESYGSLAGTHARDKDAVAASMLFAEMICYYDSLSLSVYSRLQEIYQEFGYFTERSASMTFGGIDGMQTMKNIMRRVRDNNFVTIATVKVLAQSDLVSGIKTYCDGKRELIDLPKTNAFKLELENGDWICVRPSGTEPKLKIYVATSKPTQQESAALASKYIAYMQSFVEA